MSLNKDGNYYKITVLGGGSFGTALADISAINGHKVKQWVRSPKQAEEINRLHTNTRYLPDFKINTAVEAITDIVEATDQADIIFVAIPSHSFRDVIRQLKKITDDKIIVSTTKGIEASTFNMMSQIVEEEIPACKVAVLSGPNIARELINKAITATVIASKHQEVCTLIQKILQCKFFRVYASNDTFGVQLGGALKNIYAIAAGIASAIGMGENTRSMLITRALAEMSRFAVSMGANPMTFLGLSGVGDLIVTCTSTLSRNFRLGQAIGTGVSLAEAEKTVAQTAEGINTLRLVKEKAKEKNIYMPIVSGLYAVVFEKKSVEKMIENSMLAQQGDDVDFIFQDQYQLLTPPS